MWVSKDIVVNRQELEPRYNLSVREPSTRCLRAIPFTLASPRAPRFHMCISNYLRPRVLFLFSLFSFLVSLRRVSQAKKRGKPAQIYQTCTPLLKFRLRCASMVTRTEGPPTKVGPYMPLKSRSHRVSTRNSDVPVPLSMSTPSVGSNTAFPFSACALKDIERCQRLSSMYSQCFKVSFPPPRACFGRRYPIKDSWFSPNHYTSLI